MNQKIQEIQEILKGEYIPIEQFSQTCPALQKRWALCRELDKEFAAGLNEQLKSAFEVVSQEHYNLIFEEMSRIYIEGFKYGIKCISHENTE